MSCDNSMIFCENHSISLLLFIHNILFTFLALLQYLYAVKCVRKKYLTFILVVRMAVCVYFISMLFNVKLLCKY